MNGVNDKNCYLTMAVASMRRTEALASVKFYQMLSIFFFHQTDNIRRFHTADFVQLGVFRLGCSFFLASAQLTPESFFVGGEISPDASDTTQNSIGVLDKNGVLRITRASGTSIFIPDISRIGSCRQRYPIFPVHGEGSAVWKELESLKDIVMKSKTYGKLYSAPREGG